MALLQLYYINYDYQHNVLKVGCLLFLIFLNVPILRLKVSKVGNPKHTSLQNQFALKLYTWEFSGVK